MWTCTQSIGGRPVTVTYSEVTARKPAVRFLDELHGEDARGPVRTLRGGATAYSWMPQATDDGAWEGSLLLREGPFAVTVRAALRSDASRALERRVTVRPPEVAGQHDRPAIFQNEPDRRQGRRDALGIGDRAGDFVLRDIKIDAHENAFTGDVDIAKREFGHDGMRSGKSERAIKRGTCKHGKHE